MLIRMGLAVAKLSAVVSCPKFEKNWTLKDRDVVEATYHQVVEVLNGETSLALYNAYSLVFGKVVAQRVAERYNFDCAP